MTFAVTEIICPTVVERRGLLLTPNTRITSTRHKYRVMAGQHAPHTKQAVGLQLGRPMPPVFLSRRYANVVVVFVVCIQLNGECGFNADNFMSEMWGFSV